MYFPICTIDGYEIEGSLVKPDEVLYITGGGKKDLVRVNPGCNFLMIADGAGGKEGRPKVVTQDK